MKRSALIVEDNPVDAKLIRRAVAGLGGEPELFEAHTGEQGLAWLVAAIRRPEPANIALVFLDLMLPDGDGCDVLRKLKQFPETRRIPVVVVSGTDDPLWVNAALDLHANAFVAKGPDSAAFVQRIRGVAETFLLHAAISVRPA